MEDLFDFQSDPSERMQGSGAAAAARQGHVQLAFQIGGQVSPGQLARRVCTACSMAARAGWLPRPLPAGHCGNRPKAFISSVALPFLPR